VKTVLDSNGIAEAPPVDHRFDGATRGLAQNKAMRLKEIDVARGYFVLTMLVYHCVLSKPFPDLSPIKSFVGFIHTAFLTMAGFLCSWHYLPRAQWESRAVSRRLIGRGIKLMVVFAAANIVLYGIGFHDQKLLSAALSNYSGLLENLVKEVSGRLFTFEILAYIGVFLFVAGVIISVPASFLLFSVAFITMYAVTPNTMLYFMACGFVGVLMALPFLQGSVTILLRSRALLWLVPILLTIHLAGRLISPEQTTSVAKLSILQLETLAWVVFFLLLHRVLSPFPGAKIVPLLGRYTLLAYIGQMLFIVILSRIALKYVGPYGAWMTYFTLLTAATVATCILVVACDRLRNRWRWFDWGYRVVFG
jgi:hypothetical protein